MLKNSRTFGMVPSSKAGGRRDILYCSHRFFALNQRLKATLANKTGIPADPLFAMIHLLLKKR